MLKEILQVVSHQKETTKKPLREVDPASIRVKGFIFKKVPFVRAMISRNDNEKIPVNFLFDTGSELTIISPKDTQRLGLIFDHTSDGYINGYAEDFRIRSSEVQVKFVFQGERKSSKKSKDRHVILTTYGKVQLVNPEECNDYPSILGRDAISKFGYTLDRDSLILTTRKMLQEILKLLWQLEIS